MVDDHGVGEVDARAGELTDLFEQHRHALGPELHRQGGEQRRQSRPLGDGALGEAQVHPALALRGGVGQELQRQQVFATPVVPAKTVVLA